MTSIYWAGGEDCDMYQAGGGTVTTTTFWFRSTYARCALMVPTANGQAYWQNWLPFSASQFWFTARCAFNSVNANNGSNTDFFMVKFLDSSNIIRIQVKPTSTNNVFQVFKVDSGGSATQLGSNFTALPSNLSGIPDKLDIFLNYNTSGQLTLYWNGVQVFTYTGDVTTNSVTSLANFRMGCIGNVTSTGWSEMVFTDTDSRSWNLQTLAPVANGNTHNFDIGTPVASNVNETTLNDATLDGATTAGLIDQYTIPSIAAGTYTIMAIGVSARMQKGSSGPTKMDLGVRSGGTDYWSSDQVLTTAWADYQNWWTTDPNTSATWAALPSNIGLKAVA